MTSRVKGSKKITMYKTNRFHLLERVYSNDDTLLQEFSDADGARKKSDEKRREICDGRSALFLVRATPAAPPLKAWTRLVPW